MKKLCYVFAAAFAVYALQACNGSNKNSASNADSSMMASDTSAIGAGTDSIKVDSADAQFARNIAQGGMAEIQLSKLAEQKSNNTKVKDFAGMMITDHTMLADSLKAIAQNKNISLPSSMDADHQQKYDALSKLSGSAFDKKYVSIMVDDHQSAIKALNDASKNCADPSLRNFAAKGATVVQKHLDAIKKIHADMK